MTLTNKHAPLKYKYIRANQGPLMNKELRKSIMTRSRLKHCYFRVKTEESYSLTSNTEIVAQGYCVKPRKLTTIT